MAVEAREHHASPAGSSAAAPVATGLRHGSAGRESGLTTPGRHQLAGFLPAMEGMRARAANIAAIVESSVRARAARWVAAGLRRDGEQRGGVPVREEQRRVGERAKSGVCDLVWGWSSREEKE